MKFIIVLWGHVGINRIKNDNILSAVWTQSGESGNTLKIKCSGTADERANIIAVPTTSEAQQAINAERWSINARYNANYAYSKQASAKTIQAVAHDFGSLHRHTNR